MFNFNKNDDAWEEYRERERNTGLSNRHSEEKATESHEDSKFELISRIAPIIGILVLIISIVIQNMSYSRKISTLRSELANSSALIKEQYESLEYYKVRELELTKELSALKDQATNQSEPGVYTPTTVSESSVSKDSPADPWAGPDAKPAPPAPPAPPTSPDPLPAPPDIYEDLKDPTTYEGLKDPTTGHESAGQFEY